MKKGLTIFLSIATALILTLSTFAATEVAVSGKVKTKSGTVEVSGVAHPGKATSMINQINRVRKDAGLNTLQRDSRLEEAAKQRALEISVLFSHTRPDGTKWRTVDERANGENLSVTDARSGDGGTSIVGTYSDSVSAQPQTFMQSKDHRSLILDPDFDRIETYVFERNGNMHWVQLFGAGKATADTKAAVTTTTTKEKQKSPATTTSNATTTTTTTTAGDSREVKVVTADILNKAISKASPANGVIKVNIRNYQEITPDAIKQGIKTAGNNALYIYSDNVEAGSKSVGTRMYIRAADYVDLKDNLKLTVEINSDRTNQIKDRFSKWYTNNTEVVSFGQKGNLGARVEVAVKLDLSKLNTENLVFYSYDASENVITQLENPNYSISGGYLHFHTEVGNDIVITDSAWAK